MPSYDLDIVRRTTDDAIEQAIFSDASYSKPYFVTYFNIAFFILPLLPFATKELSIWHGSKYRQRNGRPSDKSGYSAVSVSDHQFAASSENDVLPTHETQNSQHHLRPRRSNSSTLSITAALTDLASSQSSEPASEPQLSMRATFNLAFRFSLLWFVSNYFAVASLQFTTVASTTILSSTSSVFTLILGAIYRVEKFTYRKLAATIACLVGVLIISRADTSRAEDGHGGSGSGSGRDGDFPHKSAKELAVGDAMALFAALLYGVYAVAFVKTVGDESRVRMPLFFGFIGVVTVSLLWPGLLLLNYTGLEPFSLPQDARVWCIVIINAVFSLVADISWAYALLFISPLVVTVGLSLTIPLSLVGQMVFYGQYANGTYWFGALIVLSSFVFVNYETQPGAGPVPVVERVLPEDENG